jgi:diadenosine tetraphosphatase ApaH/serine/threonine PP2A family protein phosphatase
MATALPPETTSHGKAKSGAALHSFRSHPDFFLDALNNAWYRRDQGEQPMFRFLILGLRAAAPACMATRWSGIPRAIWRAVGTGNFYRELQRPVRDGLIAAGEPLSRCGPHAVPDHVTALPS